MLKNETTRQERKRLAIDGFRVDRKDRHIEMISDGAKKLVLVHFAGIEHMRCPRPAIQMRRELQRLVLRRHAAGHEEINQ